MLFRSRPNRVETCFNGEEGLKIGPLTVYIMLENRSLIGLIFHAKTKGKTWIQSNLHMEHENKVEPFFNVEEGLKISTISVHEMLQIRSHIGQIFNAK